MPCKKNIIEFVIINVHVQTHYIQQSQVLFFQYYFLIILTTKLQTRERDQNEKQVKVTTFIVWDSVN